MGTVTQIGALKAKMPLSSSSPKRTDVRWIAEIVSVARKIWPSGTAHHLAAQTRVSSRAAEFWLAGQRDMSLEAARELLRSEHGYEFLVALMGDCDARWWQRVKLRHDSAATRRALEQQKRLLEQLEFRSRQADLDID